ncbi:MAG: carbohydrate binding domain-containing protein [Clostridia bacterium]
MELTKNIFFNTDKLIENSRVKISYTGKFFQDNSEDVYIHFGFGLLWENVSEVKMRKTELGFQAEIDLMESDSFNFCFRNGNNEWDNNEGQNYSFPIEKLQTDLIVQDEPLAIGSPRRLRKTYLWSKKIRIAIYKIITYVPKIISGNYKRKAND